MALCEHDWPVASAADMAVAATLSPWLDWTPAEWQRVLDLLSLVAQGVESEDRLRGALIRICSRVERSMPTPPPLRLFPACDAEFDGTTAIASVHCPCGGMLTIGLTPGSGITAIWGAV